MIFRFKQCKWERDLLLYFFKQWKLEHVLHLRESNVCVMFDITYHVTSYAWRNLMLKTTRICTRLSAYLVLTLIYWNNRPTFNLLLVGPQWLSLLILYTVSYFSVFNSIFLSQYLWRAFNVWWILGKTKLMLCEIWGYIYIAILYVSTIWYRC